MTIAITRTDLDADGFRAAARRTRDAVAARRMLALALILEGRKRNGAVLAAGIDRQTVRERVHRDSAKGLQGLANRQNLGAPKCQAYCGAEGRGRRLGPRRANVAATQGRALAVL